MILDFGFRILDWGAGKAAVLSADGEVLRTFGDVEAEARELEGRWSGVASGDVVCLRMPNAAEWPAVLLALWRRGAVVMLADAEMAVDGRERAEQTCGARWRVTKVGELNLARLENKPVDWQGRRPDLLKLTSGTTGEPRAILFTTECLAADADNICSTMGINGTDVNYGVVAFSHSYGFSNLIVPLLRHGVPLVAATEMLPRAVWRGLRSTGATVLPGVPATFQALAGLPREGDDKWRVRLCISAGAPLPEATWMAFYERFGLRVHSFYGASECGGICYDREGVCRSGFVGEALEGVEIGNSECEMANAGMEDGMRFQVRSGAVGLSYHPPAEGDRLREGRFSPEDLLVRDADGYRIVGRESDFINVGGRKVNPAEVEAVLRAHPAVCDAAAFGMISGLRTEMVAACVVTRERTAVEDLRRHCAETLAGWQTPREIYIVEAIPRNPRGKVSRRELAMRFAGQAWL
jgi:long-chain acyl-CoA synthetase